ncbi:MAG: hypothetical protein NTX35_10350 [Verrucomicrobia bacterium]|nr:hypothetical protein [Verrucomicrobiota bacterium]
MQIKRAKHVTLVVDLESGRVLWVGKGRGKEAQAYNEPLSKAYYLKEDLCALVASKVNDTGEGAGGRDRCLRSDDTEG